MLRIITLVVLLAPLGGTALGDSAALFARLDADADGLLAQGEVRPEHTRLYARLVRTGDANGDGRLTAEEFATALAPQAPAKPIVAEEALRRPQADALNLLLLRLDTDRDATLTRDEAPRALRGVFDELAESADQDKDGRLVFRELLQGAGQARRLSNRVARSRDWDVPAELAEIKRRQGADGNRFEQRPEARRVPNSQRRVVGLFKQLDANNDGRLQRSELPEASRQRLRGLFRRADADRSGDLTQQEFTAAAGRLGGFLQRFGTR